MNEKMKIRTLKGSIYTLSSVDVSDHHISGTDKFGQFVRIPKSEIDEAFPIQEARQ
jgi:hypothetical protein